MALFANTFDEIDTSSIYASTASLIGQVGSADTQSFNQYVRAQQGATNAIQQKTAEYNLEAARYNVDKQVQRDTDLLAQMNEAWNANRYIYNAVSAEEKRVALLDKQAKRDLQGMQQSYMMTHYGIRYHSFASGILMFTMFVTLLVLVPVSLWRVGTLSSATMLWIDGVLLFIYACIMILLFRDVALRRSTNWDQYYWRASKATSAGSGSGDSCAPAPA